MTTILGSLRQPINKRLVLASYARPVGVCATPIGKRFCTSSDFERYDLSSVFTVDIDQAAGADDCFFAVAFSFHGTDHVAGGGVDCRDVMRTVIVGQS